MTTTEIITKVLAAKTPVELFEDLSDWKKDYRTYSKIHPDICHEPDASKAFIKLNEFKSELERGKTHNDDAGTVTYSLYTVEIIGDAELLKTSFDNYNRLMALTDESSKHFKKYIPTSGRMISDNELEFKIDYRAMPLSSIGVQPHLHANWITSRMLEFSSWINQVGYCHAGINPDSIYIIPENHGMMCISFYHMVALETKLNTVSGKYSNLYPHKIFDHKKATSNIDIELAKRTGLYVLGDISGTGNKLRKTHNEEIIDFLQKTDYDALETYNTYRTILRKHYDTKQFNKLII